MKKDSYTKKTKQSWWYLVSMRTLVLYSAITGFVTGFAVGYFSKSSSSYMSTSNSNQKLVL